jgi:hypothetical protein
VRVIGALKEVPIYGGKCGVRRRRREERGACHRRCCVYHEVVGDIRSKPNIPLTGSPTVDISQSDAGVSSVEKLRDISYAEMKLL